MKGPERTGILVGLDIGRVNTRVSIFGVHEGKYSLIGSEIAPTPYGYDGHLAAGIHSALASLEQRLGRRFLLPDERSDEAPLDINQQAVDRVGLSLSTFPQVKAVLLGLTDRGSLAAGQVLAGKLPLSLQGVFGLADLADEAAVVEEIIKVRPEILILSGGTDRGVEAPLERWTEVAWLVCRALPENVRPVVFYAGNPELEPLVRRRLEPICRLTVLPNMQPDYGEGDDVPSQLAISREITALSAGKLEGLDGLRQLTGGLVAVRGTLLDRMVRFLSRLKDQRWGQSAQSGILALDLGGGSTMVCAGSKGKSTACRLNTWPEITPDGLREAAGFAYQWSGAPTTQAAAGDELAKQHLFPGRTPQTLTELALTQSLARFRIRAGLSALVERHEDFPYDAAKGLLRDYGTVIASGAVLTNAPTPGQAMLMLLDGLQPWQQTTLILDRFHLLPVLGLLGETEPLLPVHLLNSDAFENLGTVLPVISQVVEGVMVLTITVAVDSGKPYTVDIPQGALRRLIVPSGESVTLTLDPAPEADVGLGYGVSRSIRVKGGTLGVVIDARGRPLVLPENDEKRVERIRHWLWSLGG